MKILAIADEESKYLWDYFEKSKLEGIDLIISCGDLDPRYLSFLATFTSAPVLYVHGNHDDKYEKIPPEGCICIDDKLFVYEGIRILGLGGSMRYKPGVHQYTEWEMQKKGAETLPEDLVSGRFRYPRDPFPCLPAKRRQRPPAPGLQDLPSPHGKIPPQILPPRTRPHVIRKKTQTLRQIRRNQRDQRLRPLRLRIRSRRTREGAGIKIICQEKTLDIDS